MRTQTTRINGDGVQCRKGRAQISEPTNITAVLNEGADRIVISVNFPGAVNSKFTTNLSFERPSTYSAIPTYRIMDSDGVVVDETRAPEDVSPEEAIKMYTNMLTGGCAVC